MLLVVKRLSSAVLRGPPPRALACCTASAVALLTSAGSAAACTTTQAAALVVATSLTRSCVGDSTTPRVPAGGATARQRTHASTAVLCVREQQQAHAKARRAARHDQTHQRMALRPSGSVTRASNVERRWPRDASAACAVREEEAQEARGVGSHDWLLAPCVVGAARGGRRPWRGRGRSSAAITLSVNTRHPAAAGVCTAGRAMAAHRRTAGAGSTRRLWPRRTPSGATGKAKRLSAGFLVSPRRRRLPRPSPPRARV
jgi:hypothetical protein